MAQQRVEFLGTGRRKTSVARVRLLPGTGNIEVNGKSLEDYLMRSCLCIAVEAPLTEVGAREKFDVKVNVHGGGLSGQAGAIRHGIARALMKSDERLRSPLKAAGFLTRDSRMKERKKYGQRGARARFQYSKR